MPPRLLRPSRADVLSRLWTVPSQGLDPTMNSQNSLTTPNGTSASPPTWLLQCLRYQHGSCFVHPCCSSAVSSRCATGGPSRRRDGGATQCLTTLTVTVSSQNNIKKPLSKMLFTIFLLSHKGGETLSRSVDG